jgi:hypothetical protein
MNEENTITNENNESKITSQKPLFTHEQRESLVRAFIEAWNTNQVWLDFPKSGREKSTDPMIDLLLLSSMTRLTPSQEVLDARRNLRKRIDDEIKIVSGSINATSDVIYKTINDLYNDIVDLQSNNLLGGSFLTREMEDRIFDKVIEKVDKHIDKVREEFGLNDI